MAETLVIRLQEDPTETASWIVVDDIGAQVSEEMSGILLEAVAQATNRRIVVLAPASQILRLRAEIPLRGAGKILQALPFALEEQIAQDVDTLHFAAGDRDPGGQVPVAVVARDLMEQWAALLDQAGINPNAVYAESDAIGVLPATTTLLIDGDRVILRDPEGNTTIGDTPNLELMLDLFLAGTAHAEGDADPQEPVNLLVYCDASQHESNNELWERLRAQLESVEVKVLADGALPKLATSIVAAPGVDLLQAKFARQSDFSAYWPAWRVAAILLLAFLGLNFAVKGAELISMGRQLDRLDEAANTLLTSTFPNVRSTDDPWGQLESRLNLAERGSGGSSTGFVDALQVLAAAVAEDSQIQMETMSFRNGTLTLRLQAPSVDSLDKLQQLISQSGRFSADIQSANPTDDGIEGRIQISDRGG